MTGKHLKITSHIVLWHKQSFHVDCDTNKCFGKVLKLLNVLLKTYRTHNSMFSLTEPLIYKAIKVCISIHYVVYTFVAHWTSINYASFRLQLQEMCISKTVYNIRGTKTFAVSNAECYVKSLLKTNRFIELTTINYLS